jgi:hypothetical protein
MCFFRRKNHNNLLIFPRGKRGERERGVGVIITKMCRPLRRVGINKAEREFLMTPPFRVSRKTFSKLRPPLRPLSLLTDFIFAFFIPQKLLFGAKKSNQRASTIIFHFIFFAKQISRRNEKITTNIIKSEPPLDYAR